MNAASDAIDEVLNHVTWADWGTRISYGVVVFSMAYIAGHLIVWWAK